MSTTFKVGDRVRSDRHGIGTVVKGDGDDGSQVVPVRFDGCKDYDDEEGEDYHTPYHGELTLVEPAAPAPDTRKRLCEINNLSKEDVVVIAGVEFRVTARIVGDELCLWRHGQNYLLTDALIADMLVDEVRRKPKTKKRRVYEEVTPSEARVGDLITQNVLMGAAKRWSGDREELEGCSVWRLVEETEVPR